MLLVSYVWKKGFEFEVHVARQLRFDRSAGATWMDCLDSGLITEGFRE